MSKSDDEVVKEYYQARKVLNDRGIKLTSYLYKADTRISEYIEKLNNALTNKETQKAGTLLEQIVVLVFQGLKGVQSIKSFQSAGPQYDLLVSGHDFEWQEVSDALYLKRNQRDIVIEAKATKDPLPDKQFARLCSIMEHNLSGAGLGIFVTLNGATGFPQRNSKERQKKVSDCRLRQIIFHARTNKIIIVLDKEDLFELSKNGTLIELLIRKIKDLSELSGLPTASVEHWQEDVDLPPHLQAVYKSNS
jgi:hypothetical protein